MYDISQLPGNRPPVSQLWFAADGEHLNTHVVEKTMEVGILGANGSINLPSMMLVLAAVVVGKIFRLAQIADIKMSGQKIASLH